MSEESSKWGTRAWFESQAGDSQADASAYYGHSENGYQIFRHNYLANWLNQHLETHPTSMIEIGCGGGQLLDQAATLTKAKERSGVDFVDKLLGQAKEKFPNTEFITDSLPNLDNVQKTYDCAIISEVLYYLNDQDRIKSIERIQNLITEDGTLLFTTRLGGIYKTAQYWEQLFTNNGFTVEAKSSLATGIYRKLITFPRACVYLSLVNNIRKTDRKNKLYQIFKKMPFLVHFPLFRLLWWLLALPSSLFLNSPSFAGMVLKLSKAFGLGLNSGNLILLLKRK